jgi:hypothetical protein
MNKLIRSAEELVYDMFLWLILLPKTFFMVFFKPGWCSYYVENEAKKEPERRFEEYLSPVIFWILLSVPTFFLLWRLMRYYYPADESAHALFFLANLQDQSLFLVFTAFLLAGPLGLTLSTHLFFREPIGRITDTSRFYLHCYFCGVFNSLLFGSTMIGIYITELGPSSFLIDLTGYAGGVFIAALVAWLLHAEARYFDLRIERIRIPELVETSKEEEKKYIPWSVAAVGLLFSTVIFGIFLLFFFLFIPIIS